MKKLFILITLLSVNVFAMAQSASSISNLKYKLSVVPKFELIKPIFSENLLYATDTLDFEFIPDVTSNGMCSFIGMRVKNKTSARIYIEWENAKMCGSRAIVGNDTRINMNRTKADEAIPVNEWSELSYVAPQANVLGIGTFAYNQSKYKNVYSPGMIALYRNKKSEVTNIPFILPIRIGENSYDYKFEIKISHRTTFEIDSIVNVYKKYYILSKNVEKGMSVEQVVNIMGQPENKTDDCLSYPFVDILFQAECVKKIKRTKYRSA